MTKVTASRLLSRFVWVGALACALWLISQPATFAAERLAPGHYGTALRDGAWWFIDPDGKHLLSLGVNCVQAGPEAANYDPGKPQYAPLLVHPNRDAWAKSALDRLCEWGFNTVGGWSDDAVVAQHRMPYTSVIHLGNRLGAPWFDVFADDYEAKFDALVSEFIVPHRDDPWLLGWFIDNELGWSTGGMFLNHIKRPESSRTRALLIRVLREHYGGCFAALKRDFDVGPARSFAELGQRGDVRLRPGAHGGEVMDKFLYVLAQRYYRVAHDAVRRCDANHLILGDRYHSYCPIPVAKAAGPYVDVASTNYDWPDSTDGHLPPHLPLMLHRATGKPVLVSEFYAAAAENRSGNRNTGRKFTVVATQDDRAAAVEHRLSRLIETPYVVGIHWFQFADEPTLGRFDGEDYNFGLVDIRDKPYSKLVAVAARLHASAATMHRAKPTRAISNPMPPDATAIPPAPKDAARSLAAWDKWSGHVPCDSELPVADLYACWDSSAVYLAAHLSDHMDPRVYLHERVPDEDLATLAVDVQGTNAPIALRFAERPPCQRNEGGLAYRSFAEGHRHTLIVSLPAQRLATGGLKEGQTIRLRVVLNTIARRHSMQWDRQLVLSAGASRDSGAAAR